MSKNFFGKEKYISEFICYQLKIETHQGGIVWHVIQYMKLIFAGGVMFCLVHRLHPAKLLL